MAYGPDWENTRPRGIDGFFIRKPGKPCADHLIATRPICHLVSSNYLQIALCVICAAPHKKGAGIALTRLAALRHNKIRT